MFFKASLYIALVIFGFGLFYKISTWFRYNVGTVDKEITTSARVSAAIKGIFLTVFSSKILTLLKVFILDVLLQIRTLKESPLRWFMHMCIFYGFMLLLLMHALEKFISAPLFAEYSSTLNPFLFLRNLFFALIIMGLAIALYRRFISKEPRLLTGAMDHYAIIVLAVIMISGVFLEASKIGSYSSYQIMVEDYADTDDEEELKSLEAFWVKEFGVVSPNVKGPFDEDVLAQGQEMHEMGCAGCHSLPQWAPVSYGVAKIIKPIALGLDQANVPTFLLYIHFLACFIGLAYLPFSKMFHIIASPLSLLANAVMDREKSDPANIATRQIMELDACTHCGTCSLQCSVGVSFEEIPNVNILPSEKLASVKALAAGKKLTEQELRDIQEGLYLCTNCYHCTLACPVGINLQDLWFNVREALLQRGYPELLTLSPLSVYRALKSDEMVQDQYEKPLQLAREAIAEECSSTDTQDNTLNLAQMDKGFKKSLGLSVQGSSTFSYCFTCTTCSTACPVVRNFENPREALGLLPHQIIHAAALGAPDMIYSSNMLWTCLGCYMCQEHCPQGVRVTDVLYEIKNLAIKRVKGKMTKS
jgi:heterodisulfide reductase subunit C